MVKLQLQLKFELEGVTDVRPADEDYEYYFTVQCTDCRAEHPKIVSFNQKEEAELSGSRGSANFVWRCGFCKREHSASFLPSTPKGKSTQPEPYTSDTGAFQPFITLDCRGLEFTAFHFRGQWKCKGVESGTAFEFDLDDKEGDGQGEDARWDDYDEKQGEPVGVSEMEARFVKV